MVCDLMGDFDVVKLYTSDGSLTGSQDIIDTINQGCGFVMTRGRGGTDRVRMVTADGEEFIAFRNLNVPLLHNAGECPIIVLGECIHGKFDVGIYNVLDRFDPQNCIPECLGWRLVRHSDGGAIATVTNTNLCYGVMGDGDNNGIPDDAELYGGGLAVDFFRQIAEGRYYHLGDVFKATLTNYIDIFPIRETAIHCKSIEEWILIGDPSLRIGGYP